MARGEQMPAVVPQYVQIFQDLRDKIKNGTFGPGALLPSRNEITAEYGVSAITARDALALLCQHGYARAIRGRGHVVRRKRSRLTLPARLYAAGDTDPGVSIEVLRLDVYQETPPDNIALPLETGADSPVWVRRVVWIATADRQPMQIHVSWIPGLGGDARARLEAIDPQVSWPDAVQRLTGHEVATVMQHTRARRANPWEAEALGLPEETTVLVTHATLYDSRRRALEHSRYTWATDAVRVSEYYSYKPAATTTQRADRLAKGSVMSGAPPR